MRCYICNKELVENVTEANQCKSHGEHIIHNGIRGKLISNQILCEICGCDYSRAPSIILCKRRIRDSFLNPVFFVLLGIQ